MNEIARSQRCARFGVVRFMSGFNVNRSNIHPKGYWLYIEKMLVMALLSDSTRPSQADVYHVYQATLFVRRSKRPPDRLVVCTTTLHKYPPRVSLLVPTC